MVIKNIVFDIGNVLLKWRPLDITTKIFPNTPEPNLLASKLFDSSIWANLNLGKITEEEAIKLYHDNLNIPEKELSNLMFEVKHSLTPVDGSLELLNYLYNSRIPLYSITDNVKEIMSFLRPKYDFLKNFIDIIVSAELGILKPSKDIYLHLINKHNLLPEETVFIDDLHKNIEGAKAVGMHGIQFTTTNNCKEELRRLGVEI